MEQSCIWICKMQSERRLRGLPSMHSTAMWMKLASCCGWRANTAFRRRLISSTQLMLPRRPGDAAIGRRALIRGTLPDRGGPLEQLLNGFCYLLTVPGIHIPRPFDFFTSRGDFTLAP